MKFRPCIDLRNGKVVQIVGGTLSEDDSANPDINYESEKPSTYFARLYARDELTGGHVIALGPGNKDAALEALAAYPGGLHYGGGINLENAGVYLDAGASHVIVTSFVFRDGKIDFERLGALSRKIGRERLVLDLSCRKRDGKYWVVTDRWTRFTEFEVKAESLRQLSQYCDEFLVHGVDVEGKMAGIEIPLVKLLAKNVTIPTTYAGGAKTLDDLRIVSELGKGKIDLTIGSALDIFGGSTKYEDVVAWARMRR